MLSLLSVFLVMLRRWYCFENSGKTTPFPENRTKKFSYELSLDAICLVDVHLSINMLDHNDLKNILPHSYPFLMLDRAAEYTKGQSLMTIKNITADEWFFKEVEDDPNKTKYFSETLLTKAASQAALVFIHKSRLRKKSIAKVLGGFFDIDLFSTKNVKEVNTCLF